MTVRGSNQSQMPPPQSKTGASPSCGSLSLRPLPGSFVGISSGTPKPMGETGRLFLLISDPEGKQGELMNCGRRRFARVHHVSDHPCNNKLPEKKKSVICCETSLSMRSSYSIIKTDANSARKEFPMFQRGTDSHNSRRFQALSCAVM